MIRMFHIKVREKENAVHPKRRPWWFISPKATSHLRIHAVQFADDKVDAALAEIQGQNPTMEFKKQPVERATVAKVVP